jgi:hypothetical protein
VKGERETYLPGSGYNEGSSNNGSGHGGFPLLMFVPCLLACSSPVLVSRRSLFVFALVLCLLRLFFLCVPLVSGFFSSGFCSSSSCSRCIIALDLCSAFSLFFALIFFSDFLSGFS